MKIAHAALWTQQLEELRDFYVRYFGGRKSEKYINPAKEFESYFITFDDGCRLAFGCSDRDEVAALTERLRRDGHRIVGEPRTTGDGCFESVAADPDGNLIELTVA